MGLIHWAKNFPRHLRSIHWYAQFRFDVWHWALGFRLWYDAAPGFHFDSTGCFLHVGPLHFELGGKDTN